MNEPMSDKYGIWPGNNVDIAQCARNWQRYSRDAAAKIRAAGYTRTISVSVYKGTGFHPDGFWFSRRTDPRVRPNKNIYFDHRPDGTHGGGKYVNSYAWELSQAS